MENLNTHKKLDKYIDNIKKIVVENELLKHSLKTIENKNYKNTKNLNTNNKKENEIINEFYNAEKKLEKQLEEQNKILKNQYFPNNKNKSCGLNINYLDKQFQLNREMRNKIYKLNR